MPSSGVHGSNSFQHEGDGLINDNGKQPAVQVADSQYQVLEGLNGDYVNASDGEAVGETQHATAKSGFTVTSQSMPSEVNHDTFVETHRVTPEDVQDRPTDVNATTIGSELIARPNSAGEARTVKGFAFTDPGLPQMDFVGTRKGPASNMPATSGTPAETPLENTSVAGDAGGRALFPPLRRAMLANLRH